MQVITLHLLHHVVEGICRLGPVYASWMYCFERFNSWMCQRVKNRANPETNVLQTYRVRNFDSFGYKYACCYALNNYFLDALYLLCTVDLRYNCKTFTRL